MNAEPHVDLPGGRRIAVYPSGISIQEQVPAQGGAWGQMPDIPFVDLGKVIELYRLCLVEWRGNWPEEKLRAIAKGIEEACPAHVSHRDQPLYCDRERGHEGMHRAGEISWNDPIVNEGTPDGSPTQVTWEPDWHHAYQKVNELAVRTNIELQRLEQRVEKQYERMNAQADLVHQLVDRVAALEARLS